MRLTDAGSDMKPIPGMPPAEVQDLSRVTDRISFLYVERAVVHRDSNAITFAMQKGTVHVPAAMLGVVMLGPGTSVSHQAMMLMADSGAASIWVGEEGVRYYAHGRPLSRSSRVLEAQAAAVCHRDKRLAIARQMYAMRFPDDPADTATMQQLRGREGARVRRLYRELASERGLTWKGRSYDLTDFERGDSMNVALSAATTCLYGVVHAATVALGASPALGFIHTGHDRSFVYDIADLYKMEAAVPVAFDIAASNSADIPADTRRAMRDALHSQHILERSVRDIRHLLLPDESDEEFEVGITYLWDADDRLIAGGTNHAVEDLPW